jgi:AcrR family transcriptional regulator
VEAARYLASGVTSRKSTAGRGKLSPGLRLPREQVIENQRERLLTAMIYLVAERGYQATNVADLLDRARVSRASFYELFDNKEDCLFHAYSTQIARVRAQVVVSYRDPELSDVDRLRAGLSAIVDFVVAWPAAAQLCTAEITTAGAAGIERREQTIGQAQSALAQALSRATGGPPVPIVIEVIVHGIEHLIHACVSQHSEHQLSGAIDELIDWMLCYDQPAPRLDTPIEDWQAETDPTCQAAPVDTTGPSLARPRQDAQREQILNGVLAVVSAKGYIAMSYADIAAEAKISLTTFYKHFQNKQEAFLAAFDSCSDQIAAVLPDSSPATVEPAVVRIAITRMLGYFASHPAQAQITLLEILNVGRAGIERTDLLLQRLARQGCNGEGPGVSAIVCAAVTGGAAAVVRQRAKEGQIQQLPALARQLTYVVLAPFIGSERAIAAAVVNTNSQGLS